MSYGSSSFEPITGNWDGQAGDSYGVAGSALSTASLRADVVSTANSQVGVTSPGCTIYGPCTQFDWCAMFVEWVWNQAGVSPVPTTWVARGVGDWGEAHCRAVCQGV